MSTFRSRRQSSPTRNGAARIWIRTCGLALVLTCVAVGCKVRDDDDSESNQQQVVADGSRIVSLGATVTEIVFALGHGDDVVAADASSIYPEGAEEVATLPYFRMVGAEGLLAQQPSVLLASEGTPDAVLEQLESAGVQVVTIPEPTSMDGVASRISAIAEALETEDAGNELIATLETELGAAATVRERCVGAEPLRVLPIYARGGRVQMVMGDGTPVHAMVEAAGAVNAAEGVDGSRMITAEAVLSGTPDVVLLPKKSLESIGGEDGLGDLPGLEQVLTGGARVVTMDDQRLLGLGPRTGDAVSELTALLHECERVN